MGFALGAWIGLSRVAIIVLGFGLTVYWITRPFLAADTGANSGSWQAGLASWPGLIGNTVLVCGAASLTSLLAALPLSFFLFRTNLPGRRPLTLGLLLLACLPPFASASALMSVVGIRTWEGSALMAGVIHGWLGIPLAVLQLGLGFRTVNGTLEENALLDASWTQVILRADWPLIRWSVLAVVATQMWLAGTEIAVTDLLGVHTLAEEVYLAFQLVRSATSQSLVVVAYVVLFGAIVWAVWRLTRAYGLQLDPSERRPALLVRLGVWRRPATVLVLLGLAVLTLGPFVRLGFEVGSFGKFLEWTVGLRWELKDSGLLAGASGVALLLVVMGAGDLAVSTRCGARWLRYALILLLAMPTPCQAIAWIEILNRPGPTGWIYDVIAAPILGLTVRWLPLCILIAAPGFASVTRDLRDMARADGCNAATLHFHVLWPMAGRFLALAGLVAVILAFGELIICLLLCPPGVLPLSVRFFTLVHYGLAGQAAAICFIVLLTLVIPWSLIVLLMHRTER